MIQPAETVDSDASEVQSPPAMVALARYGLVPQVAKFAVSEATLEEHGGELKRGVQAVVESERGLEVADVLEVLNPAVNDATENITGDLQRVATVDDVVRHNEHRRQANAEFTDWQQRIADWSLQLQIIDAERTLDEKIILYVLNDQNAETTRLALLTAAAGLGIIHVQPVSAEGIINQSSGGGGCGSGGCGSGGGGCQH